MSRIPVCSFAVLLVALLAFPVSAGAPGDGDGMLRKEIDRLVAGLHSERAKEAVRRCADALKVGLLTEEERAARQEAILFFLDMKAKSVLLAMLHFDNWSVRTFVADNCLGIFEVEDIPALYDTAVSLIPSTSVAGSADMWAEELVRRLAAATSRILRIEHVPLASFSEQAMHDWWLAAIQRAEKDREGKSGLEQIRRHFEG